MTRKQWRVSDANRRALERLIAGRCLREEPRQVGHPMCVGGALQTLEVFEGGSRRFASQQYCGRWGAAGEAARLILADAPAN